MSEPDIETIEAELERVKHRLGIRTLELQSEQDEHGNTKHAMEALEAENTRLRKKLRKTKVNRDNLKASNQEYRKALEEIAGAKTVMMNKIIGVTTGRHPIAIANTALASGDIPEMEVSKQEN